ncbi:MAG: histidine kinase [Verrucomicrobia bacterium]|nr:histidine kinase [Verrucomicrobiota bacterium]
MPPFAPTPSAEPFKPGQVEITEIPPLNPGEQSLLDFHSVINVLNVLRCEIMVLGDLIANNTDLLAKGMQLCEEMLGQMKDHDATLRHAAQIDDFERKVMEEIHHQLATAKPDPIQLAESLANMESVFAILKLRAREILARAASPSRWERFEVTFLHASLHQMFVAFEKNSKGRFRILTNAARQTPSDYYIDLKFETAGRSVYIPPIFIDVMRDLIANARKYTPPGGEITAALYQDADGTKFLIKDTGRGIPPAEIEQVVHFGKRASNVSTVRTLGGGFGLTKAFLVTKQFGGRFWIGSELGRGTSISIWLPPVSPDQRETQLPFV